MAAIKKSVRLTDDTVAVCRVISRVSRQADEVNWSGSLNAMAEEYALVMDEHKPELTKKQWYVLYCVYNGYAPRNDAREEARLLAWHVSEAYQFDEQVRHAFDSEEAAMAFINEIKTWSLTKQLAAIYQAKKFWCEHVK